MKDIRWSSADSQKAMSQGWDLFVLDRMKWDIEKCDEQDVFKDDLEAIQFVQNLAGQGDETARKALALDGKPVTEEEIG